MTATSGNPMVVVDDKDEVLSAHLAAPRSAGPQQPTVRRRPEVSTEDSERRYLHDARFHAIVETILSGVKVGSYTLTDFRQAIELAERIEKERAARYWEVER